MDSSQIYIIVVLVLQAINTILQAYQQGQKQRRAKTKKENRDEIQTNVRFLTNKHEALDARSATLQEWMDLWLTHKGLEHSSSSK
jgi:hypothetical protein